MKNSINLFHSFFKKAALFIICGFIVSATVQAQLPTAQQIAAKMKMGWNLGNTLEAIGGETAWGNPRTTQLLIDSVKAAGFNAVRLPVSWDQYANSTTNEIDPAWMARVKEVVDYCINDSLYVFINIHWDGGWLENHITTADSASVNEKQRAYWTQIANYFKDYDEHLLFASANEPDAPDAEAVSVLLSYHQTFINAVRATGGNNNSRTLIIQGPKTNIELTSSLMNMPIDSIEDRLMVEIHYYSPWNFFGMTQDEWWGNMAYYWGEGYHSIVDPAHNATWGEENVVEESFNLIKTAFVDKGVPVIVGEFAAIARTGIPDIDLHIASREYWYKTVVQSSVNNGCIPFVWEVGGLINRYTGELIDPGVVNAMMQGSGELFNVNILVDNATLTQNNGTLKLPVDVSLINWSIIGNDTDTATINSITGIITAKRNGTITVRATLIADSSLFDEATVTITNQIVEPTSIVIKGAGNASAIATNNGTLAMSVEVTPADAVNTVTWSLSGIDADTASLSAAGLLTAIRNGKVTVKAVSTVDTSVMAEKEITLSNQIIEPTSIVVKGAGDASVIATNNGTLAMSVEVTPADAVNTVTWSLSSIDADTASLSTAGLLTAIRNGKVTVKAVSTVATSVMAEKEITLSNQIVEPTSIVIKGAGNASAIATNNGTLAMSVEVTPADAVNTVTWSLVGIDADTASLSTAGLLTAIRNGKVTVKAVSTVATSVMAEKEITLSNQIVEPTSIVIKGAGNASAIATNNGTLAMSVEVTPADAVNTVTWSLVGMDADTASLSTSGLLTAIRNGKVTVTAVSIVATSVMAEKEITLSNQIVEPTSIVVKGADNASAISTNNGTLAMSVEVTPTDADNNVTWSLSGIDADTASLSTDGLLTAIRNGKVTVKAVSTLDASVLAEKEITLSNQIVEPTSIVVKGAGDASAIATNNGTLAMSVEVTPADADTKVTWSISSDNDADTAFINSSTGVLEAKLNGKVTVKAISTVANSVFGEKEIDISGQLINVSTITVLGADISTNAGTSAMSALIAPTNATEKGVTWSVSDTLIASIDAATGILTAIKNGTVTITATANETGSTITGTKVVTISGQIVKIISLTLLAEGSATEIATLGGTLKLTVTVLPADATNQTVTWTTSDSTIATVATDGTITAVANGNVTITATSNDGSDKTDTISLIINGQTGISTVPVSKLKIFPNPVSKVLNITNVADIKKIEIINGIGYVLKTEKPNLHDTTIDVELLNPGVYFVRAITTNGIYINTFVKK